MLVASSGFVQDHLVTEMLNGVGRQRACVPDARLLRCWLRAGVAFTVGGTAFHVMRITRLVVFSEALARASLQLLDQLLLVDEEAQALRLVEDLPVLRLQISKQIVAVARNDSWLGNRCHHERPSAEH